MFSTEGDGCVIYHNFNTMKHGLQVTLVHVINLKALELVYTVLLTILCKLHTFAKLFKETEGWASDCTILL